MQTYLDQRDWLEVLLAGSIRHPHSELTVVLNGNDRPIVQVRTKGAPTSRHGWDLFKDKLLSGEVKATGCRNGLDRVTIEPEQWEHLEPRCVNLRHPRFRLYEGAIHPKEGPTLPPMFFSRADKELEEKRRRGGYERDVRPALERYNDAVEHGERPTEELPPIVQEPHIIELREVGDRIHDADTEGTFFDRVTGTEFPHVRFLGKPDKSSIHTGFAGRPTPRHLIEGELARRAAAGQLKETIKADAAALCEWFSKAYPQMALPKPGTVANSIRKVWRQAKAHARN